MNDISFIIPYRESEPHRAASFEWNLKRLNALFPDAQICIGENNDEPFNRAAARNDAIRKADCKYVASVDADTVWNSATLLPALYLLEKGVPWVIPYVEYRALDPESTERVLASDPDIYLLEQDYDCERIKSIYDDDIYPPISGLTVFRREDLYAVGGFDESFEGWGFEDTAFWITCNRILGECSRFPDNVYHLWHPRGDADVHQPKYQDNWRKFDEYVGNFENTHRKFL